MNVQIAKVIGAVVLMLGVLGALVSCIALKADTTITLGLATAFGAAATGVVGWLTKGSSEKIPPGPLAVLFVTLASLTATPSCTPAQTPREQARSVVLTVAEGVRQGDLACASIARAKADLELAEGCAAVVKEARESLLIAESGVDAWDAADADKLPCATKAAADALARLLDTVRRAGGKPPPAVDDALKIVPLLAGACHG